MRSRTVARRSLLAIAVLPVLAQLIRPARTNPRVDPAERVDAHLTVPSDVQAILDRSCRDCHTNETRWPGYSAIAPVSWYVAHDVHEGREHLNFSEWGRYDEKKARHTLEELCEEVRDGEMPVAAYTWLHPAAKLAPGDVTRLCEWSDTERTKPMKRLGQPPACCQR
jgi:heme-binding protein